jgi:hypothetical protein
MPDDTTSARPNPLHKAIARLESEMTAVFERADIPSHTRLNLEQRLRELKKKAGVEN